MNAGKLRHRVTIQERTETQDRFGGNVATLTDLRKWWAFIEPAEGREFFNNQQMTPETTHRITMRYCSLLTTKHRLTYQGRIFDIESIIDVGERKIEHHVFCKEAVG